MFFAARPEATSRFVISALAMRGWVFYFNAGSTKAWITRCKAHEINTCDVYITFDTVRACAARARLCACACVVAVRVCSHACVRAC